MAAGALAVYIPKKWENEYDEVTAGEGLNAMADSSSIIIAISQYPIANSASSSVAKTA